MPPKATVKWSDADANVRLLSAIIAAHPELKLNYTELATAFGTPSTAKGIEFQFRRFKKNAKVLRDAMKAGVDTATVNIGVAFGGGGAGNGSVPSTPRKNGTTTSRSAPPSSRGKKGSAKKPTATSGSDDEEEFVEGGSDEDFGIPSCKAKKGVLNKVRSGRVSKNKSSVKAPLSDDEDPWEDLDVGTSPVKAKGYRSGFVKKEPEAEEEMEFFNAINDDEI